METKARRKSITSKPRKVRTRKSKTAVEDFSGYTTRKLRELVEQPYTDTGLEVNQEAAWEELCRRYDADSEVAIAEYLQAVEEESNPVEPNHAAIGFDWDEAFESAVMNEAGVTLELPEEQVARILDAGFESVEAFFEECAKPSNPVEPVKPAKAPRKPRSKKVKAQPAFDVMPPLPADAPVLMPPKAPARCEIIPPPFNPYKKITSTFFFSCL
jgi:predicted HicB family RNase H-like nuclease